MISNKGVPMKCEFCGKEISEENEQCPFCNAPVVSSSGKMNENDEIPAENDSHSADEEALPSDFGSPELLAAQEAIDQKDAEQLHSREKQPDFQYGKLTKIWLLICMSEAAIPAIYYYFSNSDYSKLIASLYFVGVIIYLILFLSKKKKTARKYFYYSIFFTIFVIIHQAVEHAPMILMVLTAFISFITYLFLNNSQIFQKMKPS